MVFRNDSPRPRLSCLCKTILQSHSARFPKMVTDFNLLLVYTSPVSILGSGSGQSICGGQRAIS